MAQAKDTNANAIRFGDFVYLKTIIPGFTGDSEAFLYSDGMVLGRMGVQRSAAAGEWPEGDHRAVLA